MSASIFDDKSAPPDEMRLKTALGKSAVLLKTIRDHITENYGDVADEWKFYNAKSGWTLKLLLKKRNLFFLTPLANSFRVAFVFGDKAVAAVERSNLPPSIIETLKNARKYAEGRGLQIEVKTAADAENIKKLIDIKIEN
jgi:hypothetical protein